jgi:hypothetical protein
MHIPNTWGTSHSGLMSKGNTQPGKDHPYFLIALFQKV